MKKITLKNGDNISTLGMGTWFIGDIHQYRNQEISALRYGIEHGINLIDTAEMYGYGEAERLIGEAIQPYDRESLYIVSKVLPNHANQRDIERACDNSLLNLKTDYLDMYLYHWRGSTPLNETIQELEKLKDKGKIRAWGVSNFDLEDMEELMELPSGKNCQLNQVLYHLGSRGIEYALKPWQDKNSIPTMAYSPLAQAGALRRNLLRNPVVNAIAEELECSIYQVLLLFVLAQPNTIAIPKAGQVNHVKDNIACLTKTLSPEQLKRLNNAFPIPSSKVPLDIV